MTIDGLDRLRQVNRALDLAQATDLRSADLWTEHINGPYGWAVVVPLGGCAMLDCPLADADRHWVYVAVNEELTRLNGLPASQHLGRRVVDVLPEGWAAIKPLLEEVADTKRVVTTKVPVMVQGTESTYAVTYAPLPTIDGHVVAITALIKRER